MNLKISAWASIIAAILVIPSTVLLFVSRAFPQNIALRTTSIIVLVIAIFLAAPIYLGYIRIAKLNKLKFLITMMYIVLVGVILANIYSIIAINNPSMLDFVLPVLLGIIELITGIALLKLNKVFGGLMTAIGTLYIINGVFTASFIFILLSPFVGVATSVLEAIFFVSASKKYD